MNKILFIVMSTLVHAAVLFAQSTGATVTG
jgi:hypothetical protein